MLQRGALAFKEKDLVLQEGSLALQKGRLVQLGDQTLALQGGKTHLAW